MVTLIHCRRNESSVAPALAGEGKLFTSRKSAREGQQAQLRERIAQINEEIRGRLAQQQSKEAQIRFISEELVGVAKLYEQNLVSIARYMQLQRENARLEGERGQFIADSPAPAPRSVRPSCRSSSSSRTSAPKCCAACARRKAKIAEFRERVITAEDQLKRIDIRAPQAGIVHQLAVHTIGGIIGNGEIVMLVVPRGDALVVEAKVSRATLIRSFWAPRPPSASWPATNAPHRTWPERSGTCRRTLRGRHSQR